MQQETNKIPAIAFIDIETNPQTKKIQDIGAVTISNLQFRGNNPHKFIQFIDDVPYIGGHNIIQHDLIHLERYTQYNFYQKHIIDTLYWSPLLFPKRPYHHLIKDDKLLNDEANNPINDAIKSKELFHDEVIAFHALDDSIKDIFYALLHTQKAFNGLFFFIKYTPKSIIIESLIKNKFLGQICNTVNLSHLASKHPIELAYTLALLSHNDPQSITPPWVLNNFPKVADIIRQLRAMPCSVPSCSYCQTALDAQHGLKTFFGFEAYRSYNGQHLQEAAVKAALQQESFLAVFPTGGGKSITFQIPALMSGVNVRGLTVVISPLQSLMKDQVDNLEEANITQAATINGLLDPIERAKAIERVQNGSVAILYISPESLRSKTIERLLLSRNVVRFVIDEAHCFSSWGQDFRVDYLYIADFINMLQEKKQLPYSIPVSCFTATAKKQVIEDIQAYFKKNLCLQLNTFTTSSARKNLTYKVLSMESEEDKYNAVRRLLDEKNCPSIIYVSRTKTATEIAMRLYQDGYSAKAYHGKMDKKHKIENQNNFIQGAIQIMVATSAFGMGVDKKDVGLVIHYEISDSLENYMQEAGRAGRDQSLLADCYVLFNEEDLGKHFILLNQTKLNIHEIQQIWRAVKDLTSFRSRISNSALEIARKAGWDDSVADIGTRVRTAVAALENAGYLKRGQNMPRIFANSILSKNAQEAIDKINHSELFSVKQQPQAARIIKKLFSSKRTKEVNNEVAESRIDYISDHLGIVKEEVIQIINLLREENILADKKDLTAFIKQKEHKNKSIRILNAIIKIEKGFLQQLQDDTETIFHTKELHETLEQFGCRDVSPQQVKTVINFWVIKNWIQRKNLSYQHRFAILPKHKQSTLLSKLEQRHNLSRFIIDFLFQRHKTKKHSSEQTPDNNPEVLVEFSVHELKDKFNQDNLFSQQMTASIADVEDALFYLSRIDAIKIEGGFLVIHNKMTIERLEKNSRIQYKKEDYVQLEQFYKQKIQQIHLVGAYAKKMLSDYQDALQFVEDYFQLNYKTFLHKYFNKGEQKTLNQNITPKKFKQLFGTLSPAQLKIINDKESKHIVVAAGPGSGKTRVLVHKLASLLLMEDVKHEQLLMVTFSRAAAQEFKQRLVELIGNAAYYIEIKTFHAYCFDLLGRVGSLEKSATIIQKAVEKIKSGDIEPNRIAKSVLVIDEAQDMDQQEFELVEILMHHNEQMRVIAVGDDDQNIYEFRGADSVYLEQLISKYGAIKYDLIENYRSKANLIDIANQFVQTISKRLKNTPIQAQQIDNGQIDITTYNPSTPFTEALVQQIQKNPPKGTTCIITNTNHLAAQIVGYLLDKGIPARLIQTNDGFQLYNLQEIRYFIHALDLKDNHYVISDKKWQKAKTLLWKHYSSSPNQNVFVPLIQIFQKTHKKKYKSDFEIFLRESKMEDFVYPEKQQILVSTIHKTKGKEFDNVFIALDKFKFTSDEKKRQFYVAITRAKKMLSIHLTTSDLQYLNTQNLYFHQNTNTYKLPSSIILNLSHKDVWLDGFKRIQAHIKQLKSGDKLNVDQEGCLNTKGYYVLKFAQRFKDKLNEYLSKGYSLKHAIIQYIVFWKKEGSEKEILIVLPSIKLVSSIHKAT